MDGTPPPRLRSSTSGGPRHDDPRRSRTASELAHATRLPAAVDEAQQTDEVTALRLEVEQLRAALATRDMIWTAKTVIAATTGCSPQEAHELLVRQSQFEHRKLRDVALELVNRHESSARRAG